MRNRKKTRVRKIPAFGGKGPSRIRQSFGRGLTIFLVIAACIILYFAFLRADTLFSVAGTIIEILKPIIYGFAIAYLLNPIVKETDKYLLPVLRKKIQKRKDLTFTPSTGTSKSQSNFWIGSLLMSRKPTFSNTSPCSRKYLILPQPQGSFSLPNSKGSRYESVVATGQ